MKTSSNHAPSIEQVVYVNDIADVLGIEVLASVFTDREAATEFIRLHKQQFTDVRQPHVRDKERLRDIAATATRIFNWQEVLRLLNEGHSEEAVAKHFKRKTNWVVTAMTRLREWEAEDQTLLENRMIRTLLDRMGEGRNPYMEVRLLNGETWARSTYWPRTIKRGGRSTDVDCGREDED